MEQEFEMGLKSKQLFLLDKIIYLASDLVLSFGIMLISFFVYYDANLFQNNIIPILIFSGCFSILNVLIFCFFKVYKIIISEVSISDVLRISFFTFIVETLSLFILFLIPVFKINSAYLFVWILASLSLIFLLAGIRVVPRIFGVTTNYFSKKLRVRTIVVGAGSVGKVAIDETRRNKFSRNKIVAVVDDDPNKIGGVFSNIPVKGPISEISKLIDFYHVNEVVIAISKLSEERLHQILDYLASSPVRVKRMPLLSEMEGPNDKRIIDVNLDDLLCRQPIKLDNHEIKELLYQKVVLVTGAGGSIGSELVSQIFKTHPKTLILFDIYENSTYDIQQNLVRNIRKDELKDIELITLIGSTYNEKRIEQIIKKYKPDYIYHAAAYKHVPLMEDSPMEAIRTNVIGTYNVAKFADRYNVKKMVLVSTDKAVRPTNVMGATKRFAEMIIQYYADKSKSTKYAAVRFGNVLGSNGSVVPLFKKQIEDGGPITITDKRIIRYFMTIPEAVSLILQCSIFAEGGEIFILDMGKPVKILDLAEKLIRQAGLVPNVDISIVETGLRPGEKLYEELLLDTAHQKKTSNSRIYIEEKETVKPIEEEIIDISQAFDMEDNNEIKSLLSSIINTYKITENK